MLSTMRSRAGGIFAKLLLGLLVLSFGVWGIGDIFRHGGGRALVKIDNARISQEEYQRALSREIEGFRRTLGDRYSPELIKSSGIQFQVLRGLINDILISKESSALDIVVGDEQVIKKIKTNPAFQNDNFVFDKNLFQSALANMRMSEKSYVETLKVETAGKILSETLLNANLVTPALANAVYTARQERRVADVYLITHSQLKEHPAPTQEDLKQYHSQHGKEFTAPEYRALSYITLDAPKAKSESGSQDDEAVYKVAKNLEDELAGGATMEEAAAKFGLTAKKVAPVDAQGKDKNGKPAADLPKLNNFLKLAFSLEEKTESPVTLSKEGVNFIVRADAITPEHVRLLEEVKAQVIAGWQKEEESKERAALAQQIATELQTTGKTKTALQSITTGPIRRDDAYTPPGENAPLPIPLLEEIFHLAPGQVTMAYTLSNGDYAVAVVRKIIPLENADAKTPDKKALEQITKNLEKNYRDEIYAQYMGYLSHKYSISVDQDALKSLINAP